MDSTPPRPEAVYTAWHFFLAYCLEHLLDPSRLKVQAFDKLGTLPLDHAILSQELRKMLDPDKLKGMHELTDDVDVMLKRFLERLPPEKRLEGLSPEKRLEGLSPEERLQGLTPEELERLRALLSGRN